MSHIKSEKTFETAIIHSLIENGGYTEGMASEYSLERSMFKADILHFIKETQPKQWEKLSAIHGSDIKNRLIQRLYKNTYCG